MNTCRFWASRKRRKKKNQIIMVMKNRYSMLLVLVPTLLAGCGTFMDPLEGQRFHARLERESKEREARMTPEERRVSHLSERELHAEAVKEMEDFLRRGMTVQQFQLCGLPKPSD